MVNNLKKSSNSLERFLIKKIEGSHVCININRFQELSWQHTVQDPLIIYLYSIFLKKRAKLNMCLIPYNI